MTRGGVEWWKERLGRLDDLFRADPLFVGNFRVLTDEDEYMKRGTLAEPGAAESDLAELEERLGIPLCPSYRALLQASNGFGVFGLHVGKLLSTKEAGWFSQRNPDQAHDIENWLQAGNPNKPPYADDPEWRVDIPLRSIEIAEDFDACELILLPKPTSLGNEWQVWLGIVGGFHRFETLPDYIDYTIEDFEEQVHFGVGPAP